MGGMSQWLDVEVGTDDIDLNTLPSNLALVDLYNDNDVKLVVGDLGRGEEGPKLKIFKGAMQIMDMMLPDYPLGVVGLYTSESSPIIAVAFSSCIYIYRNMKTFYKYYLPSMELNSVEMEVWKQLQNPENQNTDSIASCTETLKSIPQNILSNVSRSFLSIPADQQMEFLEQLTEEPEKKVPEIACITTLKLHSVDQRAASCLVVGTEDGEVIILDPQTFTQPSQTKLCAVKKTPFCMVATGLYSVDYRITVATREKSVCLLKREWSVGRMLFSTTEHIVSMEVMTTDHSIVVICADNTLSSYSKKGKKQWCIELSHRPLAMTTVPILASALTLVAVSLAAGSVTLYDGKAVVGNMFVRDVASVMKFGRLGQEENVFILITANGNLMLKILKRTADFSIQGTSVASTNITPPVGQKPWMIPKKSKLFLEQSMRERENAIEMHEGFQQEMSRLRLCAARTLSDVHRRSDNCIGVGALEPIALSAEVEGLGPVFLVTLTVDNSSSSHAARGLALLFHVHTSCYRVTHPYIKVPLLAPGGKLRFPTRIEEVFEDNVNPDVFFRTVTGHSTGVVKVLLLKEGAPVPVLAATIQMPPTDPMLVPYEKMQATAVAGF